MTRCCMAWLALNGCFYLLFFSGPAVQAVEPLWQVSTPLTGAELDARVAELIEQLGDEDYHARKRARWELGRIGLPAFSQLREAVNHPKIQIATDARYLVQSQNVVWWLETDSTEVRRLLMDYNALNEVERDSRLQRLALSGRPDALLALCRLARFESNESLSKSAALYLMEAVVKRSPGPTLPPSILLTIEQDERRAARWLRTLTEDMQGSATQSDRWKAFAADEALDAVKLQEANEGRRPIAESNVGALRFNNWVGKWLTKRVDRMQALEAVKQSLGLVAANDYACLEYTKWALDAQLPELVVELSKKHEDIFQLDPQLGFLLAECLLRAGTTEAAEAQAEQASQKIQQLAEKMTPIAATMNVNDIVANRRALIAKDLLVERGLFEWAEKEFKLAVALELSPRIEALARSTMGEFYWSGGEYQKAADSLRPLFNDSPSATENSLPGPASELGLLAPYFYFYEGLAEIQRQNYEQASDLLVKALEAGEPSPASNNPDIVIAMKQIANNQQRQQIFEMYFEAMVQDFRASVITSEQLLAESPDRRARDYLSRELANNCNQLAWLLCRCDVPGEEAVNLSRRSLDFFPSHPAYLDTLGRCYFTAGKIEEAIMMQERALTASPHDRQMKLQLAEFKVALTAKTNASGAATNEAPADDDQ